MIKKSKHLNVEYRKAMRRLRREATPAENVLWERIRSRRLGGLKFKRQHRLGCFIVDFCCASAKLVVELDGGYNDTETQRSKDLRRDTTLTKYGYRVVRFKNEEVLDNTLHVLERLLELLQEPPDN